MKRKTLIYLALVFVVTLSAFAIMTRFTNAQTAPYLGIVYPSGVSASTGACNIPVMSVGSTFSIDVRVDNADLLAQGTINFNDVSAFVTNYIAYYTTYNSPP